MKSRKNLFLITSTIILLASQTVFAANATNQDLLGNNETYTIISSENEDYISMNDHYDTLLDMSEDEILELYNKYKASLPNTISESTNMSKEILAGFAQYAVDNGIIDDTPEQRAAITKAAIRIDFKVVVSAGNAAGYTTAAHYLDHSLQDNPSNLIYVSSSSYSAQILNSSECQKIISEFKKSVNGTNIVNKKYSGSTTLASTTDLHLSYNKVSYSVSGVKQNGTWKLTIIFKDTYDFEQQSWKNSMTDNAAVTVLNNYAAYAQSLGAIVPYGIQVTVETSFR